MRSLAEKDHNQRRGIGERSVSGRKGLLENRTRYDRGVILPSGGVCCGRFLGGKTETEEQKTYSEAESVYRTFVYDHYTAVDQTMYDKMQEVFWEEDPSETDGSTVRLADPKGAESRVTYSEKS